MQLRANEIQAAQLMQADQIILATTSPNWEPSSVTVVLAAIDAAEWHPRPPALRVITKLGSEDVDDEVVQP